MSDSPRVADGKVVSVHYVLRTADDEPVVDTREDGEPMVYLHGAGNIFPRLEAALLGRAAGETVDAVLTPEDGYGDREADALQEVPREAFPDDLELEIGLQLTAEDDEGNLTPMFVHEIHEDHVVVDLNHPLAGQLLRYEVTIVEVRDATAEETAHGHAHGPGAHHHDD